MEPSPSLRAKRGNPEANAAQSGLPRRCAPRNDGLTRSLLRIFMSLFVGVIIQPAPVIACSGPGTQGHAYHADVIVSGTSLMDDKTFVREVVAKKLIKGIKADRYIVEYEGVIDDECVFLSTAPCDRGVYFLKRKDDGNYVVIWTEKRWKKRWKTGS